MTGGWLHLANGAAAWAGIVSVVAGFLVSNVAQALQGRRRAALQVTGSLLFLTPIGLTAGREVIAGLVHGPTWLRLLYVATLALFAAVIASQARAPERLRRWLGRAFVCIMWAAFLGGFVHHGGLRSLLDLVQVSSWAAVILLALAPLVWLCARAMRERDVGLRKAVDGLVHPRSGPSAQDKASAAGRL